MMRKGKKSECIKGSEEKSFFNGEIRITVFDTQTNALIGTA